ncbi:MAG: low molecular weight phosphatase family protein [Burkholderiaceae bacterium]|nr:MAG: low molecular weight phosphatase family protein [Burkholderiaceae bacterium]
MFIQQKFGTWRGLVRLTLSYIQLLLNPGVRLSADALRNANRLVFICQGNICRSAVAERVAKLKNLRCVSIGLMASTGQISPPEAVQGALQVGVDLSTHRSTEWEDYVPQSGDLLLAMEFRHVALIRARLGRRSDITVSLLGLWCSPAMPHLHDPFSLSAPYFLTSFRRVRTAVERIAARCHQERARCLDSLEMHDA